MIYSKSRFNIITEDPELPTNWHLIGAASKTLIPIITLSIIHKSMKYFNDFLMPQTPFTSSSPFPLLLSSTIMLYVFSWSALAGDSRNSEVRVRIRSEMEQKMGRTIGKPVLVTKICKA
jgi:hypothetical protein